MALNFSEDYNSYFLNLTSFYGNKAELKLRKVSKNLTFNQKKSQDNYSGK